MVAKTPEVDEDKGSKPQWLRLQPAQTAQVPPLCWPFPPASQNHTDKAVKLKPYVPPKRRSLNQF